MTARYLTNADVTILTAQDSRQLAEWYCLLNRDEWPAALPDPEPPTDGIGYCRRGAIMGWIMGRIDNKLISRTWNKDMTDDEHEDFWAAHYEGDEVARERNDEYIKKRAAAQKRDPPAGTKGVS